jgi:hypothetical protein
MWQTKVHVTRQLGDLADWAIWRLGPCQVTGGITLVRRSLRIQASETVSEGIYSARPLCRLPLLSLALYSKFRID